MQEHREDFEPFVEDEVPFDDYLKSMGEETTWAGHMEIQATSLVTRTNICIHQVYASSIEKDVLEWILYGHCLHII